MFIDIHVHTWPYTGILINGKRPYATPEELIVRYDKLSIEKGVLMPSVAPECSYIHMSNDVILDITKKYPDRFIPFCYIDPRAITNSPDAPLGDLIRQYRDMGCKGIGEMCANLPFSDPRVQNLFKHTEHAGIPLTFHLAPAISGSYGLYDDPDLPQLEKSLQQFPKLKFLGHSPAFWSEMTILADISQRESYPKTPITEEGAVPRLMRKYSNLYGDLSAGSGHNALARDPEYAVKFLNEFQDRLLFGTDICAPQTMTPLVDFLIKFRDSGKISKQVFQKIARENAKMILGL